MYEVLLLDIINDTIIRKIELSIQKFRKIANENDHISFSRYLAGLEAEL